MVTSDGGSEGYAVAEEWQVLDGSSRDGANGAASPNGSSRDGGFEAASLDTDVSRILDEKSEKSEKSFDGQWELVRGQSSGPSSCKSLSFSDTQAPRRRGEKMPQNGSPVASPVSRCGSSEASGDVPGEDLSGEARVDNSGACDWYPQDSMEIDAMLAQELGPNLMVAGPQHPPHSISDDMVPFRTTAAARPSRPNCVSFLTGRLFNRTDVEQVGASRSDLAHFDVGARKTEVMSLNSFLDEDIPKFPFNRTTNNAAPWTTVEA